jgi:uncharacterized protein (DUF1697 family)
MLTIKYPPYKQAQNVISFIRTGNVVISGDDITRQLSKVMIEEEFPIPKEMMEDFILASFRDALSMLTEYGKDVSTEAIDMIETLHDRSWRGTTTWLVDYVELLLGKCIKENPFGLWDVFFRNGDLYVMYQDDYAQMLFRYLKSKNELPDMCEVLGHGLFPDN